MPACRLCPLAAALLLGLLLLGLPPVAGTGAEKTGVCPKVELDLNCTRECLSDGDCADNLKCCQAGCATVCHMPNEKRGSCPEVDIAFPQLGICQDQCQVDSECAGRLKCCRNGCGKVSCITPVF
ncbi:WAP four-disulfide core domain protein 2 [Manis pentadactyla]|uniref:WAP four-disulfide core domain protein 2 n=1 Tax=Manis pentadactyla TaxID=143292 RepID=UPI001875A06B|nr:WAP four-disulfide core domain protein 2 [Manis pentadactyla]KAI5215940.1 Wap Four-Disulfide Core Domain Protein 2 [Manis pentadactyla]